MSGFIFPTQADVYRRILRLAGYPSEASIPPIEKVHNLDPTLTDLGDAQLLVLAWKMSQYGDRRLQPGPGLEAYINMYGDITRKYERIRNFIFNKIRDGVDRGTLTTDESDFLLEQMTDLRNLTLIAQGTVLRLEQGAFNDR